MRQTSLSHGSENTTSDRSPNAPRDGWRVHALDGALLWFQPRTGLNVRWDAAATRTLRRAAPRVVMFGITNRCTLSCDFCSRDRAADSAWDVDSAYRMLAGLATAGVLEVAFGGGEPLAFRGFDELVARLADTTPLALNLTTNGTPLTAARIARLAPALGEVRLSIYDDNSWPDCAELLAAGGVRFGANVLVTPARIAFLPSLLERLATLGCRDAALLSYVGRDPALHLSASDDETLAAIIADSPLRIRVSRCFGDRLHGVPLTFDGDCGAGRDYVVLTSDRKLKRCSFADDGIEVTGAEDVLRTWREEHARLAAAIDMPGCGRSARLESGLPDGVRVWQAFSGNNSGDCVLVGRFEEVRDAEKFVADLLPGFIAAARFSDSWRQLLAEAGIAATAEEEAPEVLASAGRAVLLHTDMALDDAFPSLRTLLWKRGGRAVYNGIHEHDELKLLAGFGFADAAALENAHVELLVEEMGDFERRGDRLFGLVDAYPVGERIAKLEQLAARHGGSLAAELVPIDKTVEWPRALAMLPSSGDRERLWAHFRTADDAARFVATLDRPGRAAGRFVVTESESIRPRLGYSAQRSGGVAHLIRGERIHLAVTFWRKERNGSDLDAVALTAELQGHVRAFVEPNAPIQLDEVWRSACGSLETAHPAELLTALVDFAEARGLHIWIEARPCDRIVDTIARLDADLRLTDKTRR